MKRVFCIGNGESRTGFDLETLRGHGKIYGCNAIYRDFMPDVLIGVDHGIMHEIYHAGVAQKIPCWFRDWTKVPAQTQGIFCATPAWYISCIIPWSTPIKTSGIKSL
jgi:hypothetical protein